jgi:hypothetical protein
MKALFLALFLLVASPLAEAHVGDTHFGLGGPVMVIESEAFWGFDGLILHQVTPQLEIGGETGFHFWSGWDSTLWIIPLMPTLIYDIDAHTPTFAPFIGGSLGIGILHAGHGLGGLSGGGTGVKFEGAMHLGARFGAHKNFFTDMQLGIVDGSFAFTPTIGWFF